jgi:hypothetical protein
MSALEKYDYEKLLDDIKLISRSLKLLYDSSTNKQLQYLLTEDLITRLYRDIKEMHENAPQNGRGYGGYLKDEIKDELNGNSEGE